MYSTTFAVTDRPYKVQPHVGAVCDRETAG